MAGRGPRKTGWGWQSQFLGQGTQWPVCDRWTTTNTNHALAKWLGGLFQVWGREHGSESDGLLPRLHGSRRQGGGGTVRGFTFLLFFSRCDEIYREYTRSEMKVHESSRERRMVIITSLERAGSANVGEERKELGKTERKKEERKCDRIFLSSAPITADMVPYQGLKGDQVPPIWGGKN